MVCDPRHISCRNNFIYKSEYWILGVSGMSVACFGLIINSFGLYVLLRNKDKHMFQKMLACLVTFDTCVLIFSLLVAIYRGAKVDDNIVVLTYPYITYPGFYISVCCSIYMTICMSHERYSALRDPIRYSKTIELQGYQQRKITKYLLATVMGSIAYNIFRFYEYSAHCVSEEDYADEKVLNGINVPLHGYKFWSGIFANSSEECEKMIVVKSDDVNRRETEKDEGIFRRAISISDCIVLGIMPFLLLIYFNTRIYLCVRKQRERISAVSAESSTENMKIENRIRKNEIRMAISFMAIVAVFFVCYSVNLIFGIISAHYYPSRYEPAAIWFFILRDLGQLLMVVNSSVNIILYGFIGRNFRVDAK